MSSFKSHLRHYCGLTYSFNWFNNNKKSILSITSDLISLLWYLVNPINWTVSSHQASITLLNAVKDVVSKAWNDRLWTRPVDAIFRLSFESLNNTHSVLMSLNCIQDIFLWQNNRSVNVFNCCWKYSWNTFLHP